MVIPQGMETLTKRRRTDMDEFDNTISEATAYANWIESGDRCFWCHETPSDLLTHIYTEHDLEHITRHMQGLVMLAIKACMEDMNPDKRDLPW